MRTSPYLASIRLTYRAALLVFVVTVVIGILNGIDLVDFGRDAILTHVHAGTLGFLTLSIMATTFWIFSEDGKQPVSVAATRNLAIVAAVSIVAYIGAFYSGALPARAILAVPVLLSIVWFLGWVWRAVRATPRSLAGIGIVCAIAMLLLGGTLGTLIQVQMATKTQIFPTSGDAVGSHAVAMVFSYLVLFGMVVAEWRLVGSTPGRLPRGGVAQISFLLAAGLVSVFALMFNLQPLLGLATLLEIAAVVTFAIRMAGPLRRVPWGVASSSRQLGMSAAFVVVDIALIVVVIVVFMSVGGDINRFPLGLLIASDHTTFIGVMANAIFGLLLVATERSAGVSRWLAQVTFWGLNIGLVGFLVGLIAEVAILKQVFTPIMGASILIAIAAFVVELGGTEQERPEAQPEASAA
ncbi:MAG TPA: hypothetical protein VF013_09705 [Candidatus Limnocylindria bacterium]